GPLPVGLLVWQAASVGFGAVEFAYDQSPPAIALVAALVTVVGWVALAIWAGRRSINGFVWFAAVVWLLILATPVAAMLMLAAEGDSVGPWQQAMILPILFAGGSLHPLAYFVPLPEQEYRTMIVAGAMLAVSIGCYFLTRAVARRRRTPAAEEV
ncbi:MAG: hypothetical protein KDB60_14130, partial [Propionibacteriaceae bacterium]|nr:hypothetical protein [Propionibacteriaceae bacterium]